MKMTHTGQKKRIGVFGGSFNPVHIGHLITAQDALEFLDLSKVLFVPCNQPPHKDPGQFASAAHRVAMLEKAVADNPRFEICDLEIKRGGTNYSIDTIKQLKKSYPADELYFIIGSDTLPELHQWHEINELLQLCRFVTFSRPGFETKSLGKKSLKLGAAAAHALLKNVVTMHRNAIASSDIRHRVAEDMLISYLVPPAVEKHIIEHNLYKT
jgi:nicotinate-nucleotide adenylyltransferase